MHTQVSDIHEIARECLNNVIAIDNSCFDSRRLALAHLNIDLHCTDSVYADMCVNNIYQQCTQASWQSDVSVYCVDSESLGWLPPPRWPYQDYDRREANQVYAQQGLHGAYMHDPRVWQFYDPQNKIAVQWIRRPQALPLWESGGPLRALLHWAYLEKHKRFCHAATLGFDNKGIMLVGAGGSGKSGTTLAGVMHGLNTVGDDYCLLENEAIVTAYPLYEILKQDQLGVERVMSADMTKNLPPLNWQKKYEIHNQDLVSSPFVSSMPVVAIVMPKIGDYQNSQFTEISPAQAMRSFAPSSVFQLPDCQQQGIMFAAQLCRTLPCFELQLSTDAEEIADCIKHYLQAH